MGLFQRMDSWSVPLDGVYCLVCQPLEGTTTHGGHGVALLRLCFKLSGAALWSKAKPRAFAHFVQRQVLQEDFSCKDMCSDPSVVHAHIDTL